MAIESNNWFQLEKVNFSRLKFPRISLPKIKINKPSRWFVITIAIIIQLVFVFIIFWLFDERTVFNNDYILERSWGNTLKWGWWHRGITTTIILMAVAWFFTICNEFMAFNEENRSFYKLYK